MNMIENPARLKAAATYDAAADRFDAEPLGFWARHGERAVERLSLRPRAWVLDVGCGTGASALPAAVAVGPNGQVIGLDISENMLACARSKAAAQGLANVHFELADMSASGYGAGTFDAVVSVFSLFFAPDMVSQTAELWRLLRPGGKLAVTVWGPRAFEPLSTLFSEELRGLRPETKALVRPWEKLTDPENLRSLLREAGIKEVAVEIAQDRQPLRLPEDAWTCIMGSGFRWEVDRLEDEEREQLRERILRRISETGVKDIETGALHALAKKPL